MSNNNNKKAALTTQSTKGQKKQPKTFKDTGTLSFISRFAQENIPLSITEALSSDEIKLFFTLKKLANNLSVCHSVDQKELAKTLKSSQPTISRRLNVLRINRLITLMYADQKKSNLKGKQTYRINNEPLSIEETLDIDKSYCIYLIDNSDNKTGKIQKISKEALFALPKDTLMKHQILIAEQSNNDENTDNARYSEVNSGENTDNARYSEVNSGENTDNARYSEVNSGENTEKSLDTVYITRASTPTHNLIPVGDITKKTSSSNESSRCRVFAFMDCEDYDNRDDVIVQLKQRLEDNPKSFGRKTAHAIFNLLKQKYYEKSNGQQFTWIANKEAVRDMLAVLIVNKPDNPLAYLKSLIIRDFGNEFLISKQAKTYLNTILIDYEPDEIEEDKKTGIPKSKLEQLSEFVFTYSSEAKDFRPQKFIPGQKVKALEEIRFWDAEKDAIAEIKKPAWIKANDGYKQEDLYVIFKNKIQIAKYDGLCKAIELGLIEIVRVDT